MARARTIGLSVSNDDKQSRLLYSLINGKVRILGARLGGLDMHKVLLWLPVAVALLIAGYAFYPEPTPAPIKVGILHSLTGTMAVSEKPVMEATLLAIEQINAAGGLLGRQIKAIVADGKSDPKVFAQEAERLITEKDVSVIFGCWTSASRRKVKEVVENHNHLLFYPVQYEGLEQSPNIVYLGATPNQQILPAVHWAMQKFGKTIYLLGSDYVFPRAANWLIRKHVEAMGGAVVAEHYLPLGSDKVAALVADIKQRKPSVVFNTINGDSNIAFFHALHEAGITANDIPVFSFSVAEPQLAAMHHDGDGVGHYAAWNYFQSINSPENTKFVAAFKARFGQQQVVSDPMEAAWIGVQLWSDAVRTAQSDDTSLIQRALDNQGTHAPEGVMAIDEENHHVWKTPRIAIIDNNQQFTIVWQMQSPVRPEPFPVLTSKSEALTFLQQLYDGWGQQWQAPTPSTKAKQ